MADHLIGMEVNKWLEAIFTKVKGYEPCDFTTILIKMITWYKPTEAALIKLLCPTELSAYHWIFILDEGDSNKSPNYFGLG